AAAAAAAAATAFATRTSNVYTSTTALLTKLSSRKPGRLRAVKYSRSNACRCCAIFFRSCSDAMSRRTSLPGTGPASLPYCGAVARQCTAARQGTQNAHLLMERFGRLDDQSAPPHLVD